ncbi:ribosomal protein S5 domain 2-type protein [Cristinia sonorae]|uniref:Ribosomal RNA-processing protein 42 n=1 Tax=Cristinia sonorae TaxID=1940300 RepID=A0A8K0UWS1_9AGAR|nr:ribosomal protein S5 domain 2-type protein [Cristinia sonorae]
MSALISISKAEKSYIQSALEATPPLREDGRSLYDFRSVLLATGVAPLANGSARLNIGKSPEEGGGGTEVLAATKLEVETVDGADAVDGGRIVCTVACSPAAYPHLSPNALDDLQHDYTTTLHQVISHPSLHPKNLGILRGKKAWLLNLDLVVLSDAGNVYDALFMAARAAMWDTKVPATRAVQYTAKGGNAKKPADEIEKMETEGDAPSGFDTRQIPSATDFDLPDYWDEGEVLSGRDMWPLCVTLNIHSSAYFLDASLKEEAAAPLKLIVAFAFPSTSPPRVQAVRLLGPGDVPHTRLKSLVSEAGKYAQEMYNALEVKLRDEDFRRNQKARNRFAQR